MKQKSVWACKECGHTQSKWSGSCLACQSWNTFVEELVVDEKALRFESKGLQFAKPILLKDVKSLENERIKSGLKEFDSLLGGGAPKGSLILVGGDPGIGKSTLLLQISNSYAQSGKRVLYVCGEESVEQTSIRARRLKISSDNLFLLNETFFSAIKNEIEAIRPDIVIVDSIQVLFKAEVGSYPGSIVQLRELSSEFMHIAKGLGITVFLIGHVTKSGELAGPKVLEHIVDTVLEFEGDRHGFRLLRCMKNRFGPTDDVVLYQMKEEGLAEVPNPSLAFLEERKENLAGSSIVPTLEGARAILIEVQALVASSPFASPSRRSTGFDPTRLALLLAVLEKRVGFQLMNHDVFLSIAGGLKISDPAVDLAVMLSVASSFSSKSLPNDLAVIGEVGLGGEVRRVARIENRLKEVLNLGFKKCLLPKLNLDKLNRGAFGKLELTGVGLVDEAIAHVL